MTEQRPSDTAASTLRAIATPDGMVGIAWVARDYPAVGLECAECGSLVRCNRDGILYCNECGWCEA